MEPFILDALELFLYVWCLEFGQYFFLPGFGEEVLLDLLCFSFVLLFF